MVVASCFTPRSLFVPLACPPRVNNIARELFHLVPFCGRFMNFRYRAVKEDKSGMLHPFRTLTIKQRMKKLKRQLPG